MGKVEFLKEVYKSLQKDSTLTHTDLCFIFDYFIENIADAMLKGEYIYIRGLGTFKPLPKKNKESRTYFSGKVFKPGKPLLDRLNKEKDLFTYYNRKLYE